MPSMKEKRFIIVFAKEPQRGKVKTRLKNGLSSEKIVRFYKAFLKDTVDLINRCKTANKIMAYHFDGHPRYLKRIAKGYIFHKQNGNFFNELGGFPDWPLFEDVEFLRRARKRTRSWSFPMEVITSARRFEKNGIDKQQIFNGLLVSQYLFGADVKKLAEKYRNCGRARNEY